MELKSRNNNSCEVICNHFSGKIFQLWFYGKVKTKRYSFPNGSSDSEFNLDRPQSSCFLVVNGNVLLNNQIERCNRFFYEQHFYSEYSIMRRSLNLSLLPSVVENKISAKFLLFVEQSKIYF